MYTRVENTFCNNVIEEFSSLDDAKSKCSMTHACTMLFDHRKRGTLFKMCGNPPDKRSSNASSVLYIKGTYISLIFFLPIYLFSLISLEDIINTVPQNYF